MRRLVPILVVAVVVQVALLGLFYAPTEKGFWGDERVLWRTAVDWSENVQQPRDYPGSLQAWDPVAQKERWRVQHPGPLNGGVLSTAGNLVFQGNGSGLIAAYRATQIERLRRNDHTIDF